MANLTRSLGICRLGHHLAYGPLGFGYNWMPYQIQHVVVMTWNNISCRLYGHDSTGEIPGDLPGEKINECSACLKRLPL